MASAEENTASTNLVAPTKSPQPPNQSVASTSQADSSVAISPYPAVYYPGGTPPFYPPPMWGPQQMMSPYGTPIPYSSMYHPVYAHPNVAMVSGYPAAEVSGKPKGDGGKGTSGSAGEYGSHSGGESGSNGSFNSRDNGNESQDAAHKRTLDEAFPEGEAADPSKDAQNNGISAESYYSGRRQRTVSKLPVSAPGRATLPVPQSNLNMSMNTWSGQHMPRDEKELKRERRKQSNRESARRSRMRKQQECDDLAKKVNELSSENIALKSEVEQLTKLCRDLEAENVLLMEDVKRVAMTS